MDLFVDTARKNRPPGKTLCINLNDGYITNCTECNGKIFLEPRDVFKLWESMDELIFI